MGLGKHLVRELEFEDGVDTLGRWMAHYLAELIHEAENGTTAAKRSRASQKATETILKIWEHRLSLPGEAYPLAPYKDVVKVLERLRPNDNPYRFIGYSQEEKKDRLASILFDHLTRLILTLLLMKTSSWEQGKRIDDAAIEALSDDEKRVWFAIHEWGSIFAPPSKKTSRKGKNKEAGNVSKINLNEAAVRWIDSITATLAELRSEFQRTEEKANKPANS